MSYHGRELRLGDKVNYCNDKFPFTVVKSGNYYGLQINNSCESIWLSNTLNDLTNLMRDKTTYEWFLIEENNMETIKFENNEYVWEEIEGKGRCLIPFKEVNPFKDLKRGSRLHWGGINGPDTFILVNFRDEKQRWCLMSVNNGYIPWSLTTETLKEFKDKLFAKYKSFPTELKPKVYVID